MLPDTSTPLTSVPPSASRTTSWPFWATLSGGILLAAGLLLPLGPVALYVTGLWPGFVTAGEVEAWDLSANVLEGLGFLCGFLGTATALRMPSQGSPETRRRHTFAVLLGGILVTAGILVASAFAGYVFLVGPAASLLILDVGEVAGRLLQAVGFLLVFAGMAWALRARL